MVEVVVYLAQDYSKHESIWVQRGMAKEEVTERVHKAYPGIWFYYDILPWNK